jgi:tetratricopeptide (TPR) repeat protein
MENLTPEQFDAIVNEKLDEKKLDELETLLNERYRWFLELDNKDYLWLATISGSYISLGDEWHIPRYIDIGMKIVDDYRQELLKVVSYSTLQYYEGNVHAARYHIAQKGIEYKLPKPQDTELLFQAKNAFLRAYKNLDSDLGSKFSISVYINLGNNLLHQGRIVEALMLFDKTLAKQPEFINGLLSKAECLVQLVRLAKMSKTPILFAKIHFLYKDCLKNPKLPRDWKAIVEEGIEATRKRLDEYGFLPEHFLTENEESKKEYNLHSPRVKYFLDNFLSLSEHGLYCKCAAAAFDDLKIGIDGWGTKSKDVMQLEVILNQTKSEFALARNLLYEFETILTEDTIVYQEIAGGVVNGINVEKLRTAFRLCFGILDKLAHGICHMLEIEPEGNLDFIAFNTFWFKFPKSRLSKINSRDNIHLTGLYSMAQDLHHRGGELEFYKKWRNELEHNALLIKITDEDRYNILDEDIFPVQIETTEFKEKTLQVLQFTRAALLTFVFCAREEYKTSFFR